MIDSVLLYNNDMHLKVLGFPLPPPPASKQYNYKLGIYRSTTRVLRPPCCPPTLPTLSEQVMITVIIVIIIIIIILIIIIITISIYTHMCVYVPYHCISYHIISCDITIYIYMFKCTCLYVEIFMYVYVYVCMHVCIYTCIYIYMYVYMYVYMYICEYT